MLRLLLGDLPLTAPTPPPEPLGCAQKLGPARYCMGVFESYLRHRPGAASLVLSRSGCAQFTIHNWRRLGSVVAGAHCGSSRAAAMQSAPPVQWDEEVDKHMQRAFGSDWADMKLALSTPPTETCVRVNTLRTSVQGVTAQLQALLGPGYQVQQHPAIGTALMVRGSGQCHDIDYSICGGKEVVVTRKTGEAMMKGADLYVPGVLACSAGVSAGDLVAVSIALDEDGKLPFTRGTTLPTDANKHPTSSGRQLLGIGKAALGRIELFRAQSGVAVTMEQRVYDSPPLNGMLAGSIMLQHLPSVVAAMALAPTPGARVLDMCAAPGGKTTMLAQLMQDQGEIIAFDRSHVKADQICSLAAEQGFTCIQAFKQDALKAVAAHAASQPGSYGDEPASATARSTAGAVEPLMSTAASGTAPAAFAEQALATTTSTFADAQQTQATAAAGATSTSGSTALSGNQKIMQRQARKLAAMARHGHVPAPPTQQQSHGPTCSGYPPASFEYVLLDAPCTATGLRPRLVQALDVPMLQRTATYQRQLLDVAVQLLKPGGYLVYSTCSITPDENECNVRYVLDTYLDMKLVPQPCHIGGHGMTGPKANMAPGTSAPNTNHGRPSVAAIAGCADAWLPADKAAMLQRFDPRGPYIGFFCAKFCKDSVE